MDHLRFQSNQTAAAYVADGLDHETQEAFELHLMTCADCVQEVEVWRSLQGQLAANGTAVQQCETQDARERTGHPAHQHARQPAPAQSPRAPARFRLAAVLIGVGLVGGAGGWYARSAQSPWSDAERTDFYNLPALTRGVTECSVVKLGPHASVLALRIPDLDAKQQLVVMDTQLHDLPLADYSVRAQSDGSWLVRVRADMVRQQGLRFVSRTADGDDNVRGCILSSPSE
jgi:hypothetical protein